MPILSNINIIVAVDAKGGFAKQKKIPWYYKEDFQHFRNITIGHACLMGRNTYDEINERLGEKAKESVLPGRTCYVISNKLNFLPNATVVQSPRDIVHHNEIFVIGGKTLFNDALDYAQTVYLTRIAKDYGCDMFFNMRYLDEMYYIAEEKPGIDPDLTFLTYKRKK